jgi:enoyl-CoA hydratase/carnithine racemase
MARQTVHAEQSGRVLTVRLDNPPRNFMNTRMVGELDELVKQLESDRSVGSVVITGALEGVFITHFDVDEIRRGSERVAATISSAQAGGSLRAIGAVQRIPGARALVERTPVAGMSALLQIHDLFLRMNRLDKVFIAAINGVALGAGCELALACDVRVMAKGDHVIGLPEITLGIIPGAGGTQRLARILGPSQALEMMLEGRVLSPGEALAKGLVHRVSEPERLIEGAASTAERLARRSPAAVAALKRAVYEGSARPLQDGLHIERAGFISASSTAAAKRAMRAYANQVGRLGEVAPWQAAEVMSGWQDGTEVDMVSATP